ncbi:MAG: type I DNA topoisomerase [Ignavibacteriaceae bacterium]|jgi:DNA topoisomerase-1|nr:type I DNA topoisomerase [Ignavibacteriaceae bacterium]
MIKNLVIVESPAKASTIEKFLGKDYTVTSSYGHIRDLVKKDMGIDTENGFLPKYEVPADKKKKVSELKKMAKEASTVWLATDEDREGEAISWHLKEALAIPNEKIKRIVFHEITKPAILEAVSNPRTIDDHLVDAQQSRRILDRLVGFELSPVLWKKVRPSLSAGRVQSVAVRLIVDREREIQEFVSKDYFNVSGLFKVRSNEGIEYSLKGDLNTKFEDYDSALNFLEKCVDAKYSITALDKKEIKKSPAPPFTTSTLQQEAARKLRYSVSKTMRLAQNLYEAGHITYMRTDSVNLSDFALGAAKETITQNFGSNYHHSRKYKTKSANAQEAHEAIRPTYFSNRSIANLSREEAALYDLIWKRALASQMSDAKIEKTTADIGVSTSQYKFIATGEVILFDGFLKLYIESKDDDDNEDEDMSILPPLTVGQSLDMKEITATQRFTRPSARYTEAALVKKLEELGIGRPSTYAPIISTVQDRGYVVKEEREGKPRNYNKLTLNSSGKILKEEKTEITGADKGKMFPTDIAFIVNDFLVKHFPNILDFKFTAKIEKQLDDIAKGEIERVEMLKKFYGPFHKIVKEALETGERAAGVRELGKDPKTGLDLIVRMARYGPVAQIYNPDNTEIKPRIASLKKNQRLDTITLEAALDLFRLPRIAGEFEGEELMVAEGRFGPYVKHASKFYSIPKNIDPLEISESECIEIITIKRTGEIERNIKSFTENPEVKILNGRFGPYITNGKVNAKIPKGREPKEITYPEAVILIAESAKKEPTKRRRS